MRSGIACVIKSILEFRCTHFLFFAMSDTTLSFWPGIAAIFQVTSVLLFCCKERYCSFVSSGIFHSSIQEMLSVVCLPGFKLRMETYCFSLGAWNFVIIVADSVTLIENRQWILSVNEVTPSPMWDIMLVK